MKYIKPISTLVLIVLFGVGVMTMIVALTGCSTSQPPAHKPHPYSGDHKVSQLRGMFSVCLQTRMRALPGFPGAIHFSHCDCVVDKSREQYSSSDYSTVSSAELEIFFRDASIECNVEKKMLETKIKPDPTSI